VFLDELCWPTEGMEVARRHSMAIALIANARGQSSVPTELLARIQAEYLEMPGLSVTLPQAARLWNIDRRQCLDALEALTGEGFLYRSRESYLLRNRGRRGK
jgi:hypothetical protein